MLSFCNFIVQEIHEAYARWELDFLHLYHNYIAKLVELFQNKPCRRYYNGSPFFSSNF